MFRHLEFRHLRDIFYLLSVDTVSINKDNYIVLGYHIINTMYVSRAITYNTKDILTNMLQDKY